MLDPFDEGRILAQSLVPAVAAALGRTPTFDGLHIRPTETVVVVNAVADEQLTWIEQAQSIGGSDIRVLFVERPLAPEATGFSMIAARGCGTLDFQNFDCGCRASQLPGDDGWQLIRSTYCRFAADVHKPRSWPIDGIVRPGK